MNALQDIFESYTLNTPDGNDFFVLQKYIEKYPQFEREILEFAKERALLEFESEAEMSPTERLRFAEISRRNFDEFWKQNTVRNEEIESLTAAAKKIGMKKIEFARKIGLNATQLFNLEIRRYVFSTVPKTLIGKIAEVLQTSTAAVENFLNQSPRLSANYKSKTRPEEFTQIGFSRAIEEDETLSAEEKERLLKLK